jgi:tetratricopeptide (TPR) repeat protein
MEKEVMVIFNLEGTDMYMAAQMNKNKADSLLKKGKYSRAINLYTKVIGSCPMSDIIIYRRGLARYYTGDLERALNDFERVSDLGSHRADPMLTKLQDVAECAKMELD